MSRVRDFYCSKCRAISRNAPPSGLVRRRGESGLSNAGQRGVANPRRNRLQLCGEVQILCHKRSTRGSIMCVPLPLDGLGRVLVLAPRLMPRKERLEVVLVKVDEEPSFIEWHTFLALMKAQRPRERHGRQQRLHPVAERAARRGARVRLAVGTLAARSAGTNTSSRTLSYLAFRCHRPRCASTGRLRSRDGSLVMSW